MAWWITFENGPKGCVEGAKTEDDAKALATQITGRTAIKAVMLPYPADPRLNKVSDAKYGPCPSFCYTPDQCQGRSACPKNYACSE